MSAFPAGWWSFDLGPYRPCDSTYELYDYDSVPPLDPTLLRGELQWLGPTSDGHGAEAAVAEVAAQAEAHGLALPPVFLRFMGDTRLQDAVPSCTACEWDLGDAPMPCRVVPGAFTLRFLRDQQDCLFWYLHLVPGAAEPVVLCSPIPFDDPELEVDPEVVVANTWQVETSFEAFLYRLWMENVLWELVQDPAPELTPAQRAYLAHYGAVA
jgi:hypothetical protein